MNNSVIKQDITYSDKEKMILLLPMKTGTMHATFMFNHFDFITEAYDLKTKKVLNKLDMVIHHHCMNIPQRYEDYSIICTARNPYSRLVSAYNNSKIINSRTNVEVNKPLHENFKNYFSKAIDTGYQSDNGFPYGQNNFLYNQTPKYFLRIESLYYDYIQIPFIRNSKLNKSGLLYELCNKKIHTTPTKRKSLKEHYTQDMADFVYDKFKFYFDLLGYDKDSWKYE
jgi:hypothetical protein